MWHGEGLHDGERNLRVRQQHDQLFSRKSVRIRSKPEIVIYRLVQQYVVRGQALAFLLLRILAVFDTVQLGVMPTMLTIMTLECVHVSRQRVCLLPAVRVAVMHKNPQNIMF